MAEESGALFKLSGFFMQRLNFMKMVLKSDLLVIFLIILEELQLVEY
jgi:hypothetical protein